MKKQRWDWHQWQEASDILWQRDRGMCGWCGKSIAGEVNRHHRQRRRDGGDTLQNLVLLHPWCHNMHKDSVHDNPALAKERGFIVSAWDDPAVVPLDVRLVGVFLLLPDGTRERAGT